jgi:hypothetical protein
MVSSTLGDHASRWDPRCSHLVSRATRRMSSCFACLAFVNRTLRPEIRPEDPRGAEHLIQRRPIRNAGSASLVESWRPIPNENYPPDAPSPERCAVRFALHGIDARSSEAVTHADVSCEHRFLTLHGHARGPYGWLPPTPAVAPASRPDGLSHLIPCSTVGATRTARVS